MKFFSNIKEAFATDAVVDTERDRGSLVETLLLIAGFAIATILAVNWLSTALLNKAADISECIEGANTFNSADSTATCEGADHAGQDSFKDDEGYKGRFG